MGLRALPGKIDRPQFPAGSPCWVLPLRGLKRGPRKRFLSPKKHTKRLKSAAKTHFEPRFCVFVRNSRFNRALLRAILVSHALEMRAILVKMSHKIAKLQANAGAPNGRSRANIWRFPAAEKPTFVLILR